MIDIGNYRDLFLKLFCMEFKLRKCVFLQKFNDKKIISLRPRMSFDRRQIIIIDSAFLMKSGPYICMLLKQTEKVDSEQGFCFHDFNFFFFGVK